MSYKIGYMGWLGNNNIGDEACFETIKSLLPYNIEWQTWDARSWTYKGLPDLCVLGGGTLFDIRHDRRGKGLMKMHKQGVPMVVWGTGVMPLTAPKRPKRSKMDPKSLIILNNSKFVGVRGPISKNNLDVTGFKKSTIVGDPALLLHTGKKPVGKSSKVIALNIGDTHKNLFGTEDHVLKQAIEFTKLVTKKGYEVRLFAMWPQDYKYLDKIPLIDGVIKCAWDVNTKNLINFFKDCGCVVGLKLHASVLSASASVPFISWGYREKCFDFAKSVKCNELVIKSNDTNLAHTTVDKIDHVFMEYDNIVKKLNASKQNFRKKHKLITKVVRKTLGIK